MSCQVDPAVLAPSRRADALRYVRPLVLGVLRNWLNYSWSLQGFGMLRTYTRYVVHPCTHTDAQVAELRVRVPFIKERIVCGPGGGVEKARTMNGVRVWLVPAEPETYAPGDFYRQRADEVHHTWCEDGTVTLVHRTFKQDTEHAHVFYKADASWVSAEPREARPDEVSAIVDYALARF